MMKKLPDLFRGSKTKENKYKSSSTYAVPEDIPQRRSPSPTPGSTSPPAPLERQSRQSHMRTASIAKIRHMTSPSSQAVRLLTKGRDKTESHDESPTDSTISNADAKSLIDEDEHISHPPSSSFTHTHKSAEPVRTMGSRTKSMKHMHPPLLQPLEHVINPSSPSSGGDTSHGEDHSVQDEFDKVARAAAKAQRKAERAAKREQRRLLEQMERDMGGDSPAPSWRPNGISPTNAADGIFEPSMDNSERERTGRLIESQRLYYHVRSLDARIPHQYQEVISFLMSKTCRFFDDLPEGAKMEVTDSELDKMLKRNKKHDAGSQFLSALDHLERLNREKRRFDSVRTLRKALKARMKIEELTYYLTFPNCSIFADVEKTGQLRFKREDLYALLVAGHKSMTKVLAAISVIDGRGEKHTSLTTLIPVVSKEVEARKQAQAQAQAAHMAEVAAASQRTQTNRSEVAEIEVEGEDTVPESMSISLTNHKGRKTEVMSYDLHNSRVSLLHTNQLPVGETRDRNLKSLATSTPVSPANNTIITTSSPSLSQSASTPSLGTRPPKVMSSLDQRIAEKVAKATAMIAARPLKSTSKEASRSPSASPTASTSASATVSPASGLQGVGKVSRINTTQAAAVASIKQRTNGSNKSEVPLQRRPSVTHVVGMTRKDSHTASTPALPRRESSAKSASLKK